MSNKDLRAEQIKLLKFERTLQNAAREKAAGKPLDKAPILAGLALVAAAGAGAAEKLGTDAPLAYAAEIEAAATSAGASDAWLISLAEVVTTSHIAIQNLAEQGAFLLFKASGGTPKIWPSESVSSLLKSGLF